MNIINLVKPSLEKISKNKGLSLLILNFTLIIMVFFLRDPLSLFIQSYKKSEAWLDSSMAISEIQLDRYSFRDGQPSSDYSQRIFLEENLSDKDELQKVWKMEMVDSIYILSTAKINFLLEQIYDTRKFTKLGGSPFEYGFDKGYVSLKVHTKSGEKVDWKLSEEVESSGGSYLQDDSGDIYYLPFSMLHSLGRFTPLYLVEKKLFPSEKELSSLLSINVQTSSKFGYRLGREGNDWFLLGQDNRKINESKLGSFLEQWQEIQAVDVHSKKDPSWRKISDSTIHLGIQENGLPKSLKLICSHQDKEENYICSMSDRGGYFAFSRFGLEEIIQKTEKDF